MKRITHQKLLKQHAEKIVSCLGYDSNGPWRIWSMNGKPYPNRRVCFYGDDILVKFKQELSKIYILSMKVDVSPRVMLMSSPSEWELLIINKRALGHCLLKYGWNEILKNFLEKRVNVDLNLTPEENIILADMGEL